MKKNMGSADKLIRIMIAIAIAVLYYTNVISGTLAIVLGVVALIFLLTSIIGTCPIYRALGISSLKKNQ